MNPVWKLRKLVLISCQRGPPWIWQAGLKQISLPTDLSQIDRHTRIVTILKFALPVVALGLFASIFTFNKQDAIRDGLIFTTAEMASLATGQKITKPHFAGVTASGEAFTLSAKEALPDAPKPTRIALEFPSAQINTTKGLQIVSKAAKGVLDIQGKLATLTGDVSLETSNGYSARSEEITVDFSTGNARSNGRIIAKGPVGFIEAGGLEARQNLDIAPTGGSAVLLFTGGVKLVYSPAGTIGSDE